MIVRDFDDMRLGLTPLSKLYYGHDLIWKRERKKAIMWELKADFNGTNLRMKKAVYGNGRYISTGNVCIYSTDSPNWNLWNWENNEGAYWEVQEAAYGDGVFLASMRRQGGDYEKRIAILSSIDGVNWETVSYIGALNTPYVTDYMSYVNGTFIFRPYGGGDGVYVSRDRGLSWNQITYPIIEGYTTVWTDLDNVQSTSTMTIARTVGIKEISPLEILTNGFFIYSLDNGYTWSHIEGTESLGSVEKIAYLDGNVYVLFKSLELYKVNESNLLNISLWEKVFDFSLSKLSRPSLKFSLGDFCAGDGIILITFPYNGIAKYATSQDEGNTWDIYDFPYALTRAARDIHFTNGLFVAVGTEGAISMGKVVN